MPSIIGEIHAYNTNIKLHSGIETLLRSNLRLCYLAAMICPIHILLRYHAIILQLYRLPSIILLTFIVLTIPLHTWYIIYVVAYISTNYMVKIYANPIQQICCQLKGPYSTNKDATSMCCSNAM